MENIKCPTIVAILMATYNGEKYLREQIESLRNQLFRDWTLFIQDDGSSDSTISIIHEFEQIDSRIRFISNQIKHRGVKDNFLSLLKIVDAKYYMFCDQDDIWLPEKISCCYHMMTKVEENAKAIPILIATDLTTIDSSNKILALSLWQSLGIKRLVKHPEFLEVAQMYTGCTMFFNNHAKLSVVDGRDSSKIIHDQKLTLNVYASAGRIITIDTPTILYRQHDNNVLGAQSSHKDRSLIQNIITLFHSYWYYYSAIKPVIETNIMRYTIKKIIRIVKYR